MKKKKTFLFLLLLFPYIILNVSDKFFVKQKKIITATHQWLLSMSFMPDIEDWSDN